MSDLTQQSQRASKTGRSNKRSLPILALLACALLSTSGCVGLTQAGSPASKSPSGATTPGILSASGANLNFGNVITGSSGVQTLTLKNTGETSLTISQATVTGSGFSLLGSMASVSIAAGNSHAFQVRFSPAKSGSDSGSITITSDAKNSTLIVPLNGDGIGGVAISSQPASETVKAGQSATFSVVAAGSSTLRYQWKKGGAAISGATAATYTTPPTTVSESGESFTVTVSEEDDDNGVTSAPAMLTVDALPASTLTASKTSLSFSNVGIGASMILPVAFTNQGGSSVTISNVSIAGAGYSASGIASGQILAPGQSATLNVTFDPSSAGTLAGAATVTSDAANSPAKITLSGMGVQVQHSATLNWTASTSTVAGYNVYRSNASGGPYAKLDSALASATTSTDAAVNAGQTYYYVVTSVDSSGDESVYSNEVSATIP